MTETRCRQHKFLITWLVSLCTDAQLPNPDQVLDWEEINTIKLAKIRESIISSLHQGAPLPAWSTEGQHISFLCGPYTSISCVSAWFLMDWKFSEISASLNCFNLSVVLVSTCNVFIQMRLDCMIKYYGLCDLIFPLSSKSIHRVPARYALAHIACQFWNPYFVVCCCKLI